MPLFSWEIRRPIKKEVKKEKMTLVEEGLGKLLQISKKTSQLERLVNNLKLKMKMKKWDEVAFQNKSFMLYVGDNLYLKYGRTLRGENAFLVSSGVELDTKAFYIFSSKGYVKIKNGKVKLTRFGKSVGEDVLFVLLPGKLAKESVFKIYNLSGKPIKIEYAEVIV